MRLAGGERIGADAVVLAAGPWSAQLAASAGLELPLEPRKGQLVQLAAPRPGLVNHKVVDGSYLHAVASADGGLAISTVVETTWEGDILVGSSRERRGFDTTVDPAVGAALVARAARLFPRLAQLPVAAAWAGLRPWLPDHLPAIGPSRAVPGLWLATGHEGAGVALGPVTGRLVAQLYTGEPPLVDPAPFDPDRFNRAAPAWTVGSVQEAAQVRVRGRRAPIGTANARCERPTQSNRSSPRRRRRPSKVVNGMRGSSRAMRSRSLPTTRTRCSAGRSRSSTSPSGRSTTCGGPRRWAGATPRSSSRSRACSSSWARPTRRYRSPSAPGGTSTRTSSISPASPGTRSRATSPSRAGARMRCA